MTSATSELGSDELERLRAGLEILALRSLGDREAAEEAAQETLTRAVEASRQGRIKNPEKLGAFVRGIARHVIADMIRARKHTTGLEGLAGTPSTLTLMRSASSSPNSSGSSYASPWPTYRPPTRRSCTSRSSRVSPPPRSPTA